MTLQLLGKMPLFTYWKCHNARENIKSDILAGKMPLLPEENIKTSQVILVAGMHFGKMPCAYAGSLSVEILSL